MEYLINVALGFLPVLVIAPVVFVLIIEILKRFDRFKGQKLYRENFKYLGFILIINLLITMFNPSITYKHEPFDADRESANIEQLNAQEASAADSMVIEDRTKPIQGKTDEEFDNMVEFNNDGRD